jgi:SSS family solute:Na+ symporter
MTFLDYLVLIVYFGAMVGVGVWALRKVKTQEDYFMGGRSFGKLLQTFAAFGAGTGSSDPVNTARTTFTSGMSGMWSVMYWLFVTPFYWITAVWYRRMRHRTLGDWFAERYESPALGAAYTVFGLLFFMVYGSMMFSAIGKVTAPLIGTGTFSLAGWHVGIEYILVPVIAAVVLAYTVMGGLHAAYWTDLIQGLCIVALSVLLIPFGLHALVEKFGDPATQGLLHGLQIMHEQLPKEQFSIVGARSSSEFPLYFIVTVVLMNLIGVVIQPHMITTGGGSAKTEMSARVGLVAGTFLKRICTVGWALTALIALALLADSPELAADPAKTWGVASRELLGPGLTGLMLACLVAALMSSIDAYMIVGAALVVRNIYAPFINPKASEAECVKLGRITAAIVVVGSVAISLFIMDVFAQLQLAWVVMMLFAAPFWIGILWRRGTTTAVWWTVISSTLLFFIIPWLAPRVLPSLTVRPALTQASDTVVTSTHRAASPSDVKRRQAVTKNWQAAYEEVAQAERQLQETFAVPGQLSTPIGAAGGGQAPGLDQTLPSASDMAKQSVALEALAAAKTQLEKLGPRPEPVRLGETTQQHSTTGGVAIFWSGGLEPIDANGQPTAAVAQQAVAAAEPIDPQTSQTIMRYPPDVQFRGKGNFQIDLLPYQWVGIDLTTKSNAMLKTLQLPPKIVIPFLVMISVSLLTKRNSKEALDRYYAKMKTPVDPDPAIDRKNLAQAYKDPARLEELKLLPGSDLEIQKPTQVDIVGFLVAFTICFLIIGLAAWVANIGAG